MWNRLILVKMAYERDQGEGGALGSMMKYWDGVGVAVGVRGCGEGDGVGWDRRGAMPKCRLRQTFIISDSVFRAEGEGT